MDNVLDCVTIERMNQIEFSFFLTLEGHVPLIELMVVDHDQYKVRKLGEARTLQGAFGLVEDCIQQGFQRDGVSFQGRPDYSLEEVVSERMLSHSMV